MCVCVCSHRVCVFDDTNKNNNTVSLTFLLSILLMAPTASELSGVKRFGCSRSSDASTILVEPRRSAGKNTLTHNHFFYMFLSKFQPSA